MYLRIYVLTSPPKQSTDREPIRRPNRRWRERDRAGERHGGGGPPAGELPGEPARPRLAAARPERAPNSLPTRAEKAARDLGTVTGGLGAVHGVD